MSANRKWLIILFALLGLVPIANDVHAIIGMPLTPLSFAGVARRSVRRAAYAYPPYAYPPPGYPPPGYPGPTYPPY
jgi:hypothetical protein